jgi:uncharacterized membrane protein YpjA
MAADSGVGERIEGVVARYAGGDLPDRPDLPRYVQPIPAWVENVGLRLAWLVVAINLVGTAFGFYYYGFHPFSDPIVQAQFAAEPAIMWAFVPDSPVATLFIALSVAAWKLGRPREWLNALAFFGCLKLGAWTPFVLLAFFEQWSYLHPAMFHFLFWSHLAMVLEGFVIYRYADFPVWAVALALLWYGFNDVVDYFVGLVGTPHHTFIPPQRVVDGVVEHVSPAHEIAAAGAIVLTLLAVFLSLATRVKKLEGGYL